MLEPPRDRNSGRFVAVDGADDQHAWATAGMAEAPGHDAGAEHRVTRDRGGRGRHRPADRCREDRHCPSMAEKS